MFALTEVDDEEGRVKEETGAADENRAGGEGELPAGHPAQHCQALTRAWQTSRPHIRQTGRTKIIAFSYSCIWQ